MSEFFENQSIAIEDLPSINTQDYNHIEKRFKYFLHLRNLLLIGIAFGALLVFHIFNEVEIEIGFGLIPSAYILLFIIWVLAFILVELGFPRKSYLLREHDLLYRTGYLMQKMTSVPKNRIQHIEIRQSIFLRFFNLSKLVIFTAGGSSSDLSISGLNPQDAEYLKEHISLSISEHE